LGKKNFGIMIIKTQNEFKKPDRVYHKQPHKGAGIFIISNGISTLIIKQVDHGKRKSTKKLVVKPFDIINFVNGVVTVGAYGSAGKEIKYT
jgi:hypothetical protein